MFQWESLYRKMGCTEVREGIYQIAIYFVTSGLTGAGFGDIKPQMEEEIIKIFLLQILFVIFKAGFLALILAIVFAHGYYKIMVQNKLKVVTNYLNRRMLQNEDCVEFQVLHYFINDARPEKKVSCLKVFVKILHFFPIEQPVLARRMDEMKLGKCIRSTFSHI